MNTDPIQPSSAASPLDANDDSIKDETEAKKGLDELGVKDPGQQERILKKAKESDGSHSHKDIKDTFATYKKFMFDGGHTPGTRESINAFGSNDTYRSLGNQEWVNERTGDKYSIKGFNKDGELDLVKTGTLQPGDVIPANQEGIELTMTQDKGLQEIRPTGEDNIFVDPAGTHYVKRDGKAVVLGELPPQGTVVYKDENGTTVEDPSNHDGNLIVMTPTGAYNLTKGDGSAYQDSDGNVWGRKAEDGSHDSTGTSQVYGQTTTTTPTGPAPEQQPAA